MRENMQRLSKKCVYIAQILGVFIGHFCALFTTMIIVYNAQICSDFLVDFYIYCLMQTCVRTEIRRTTNPVSKIKGIKRTYVRV